MEWIKFDLHHHTGEDKDRKEKDFDYMKIIKKLSEENVRLISITNHNTISKKSISKYQSIIDSSKDYEIKILPGIELEFTMSGSKKKGHLVLIFPDDYKVDDLESFFSDKSKYDCDSLIDFKEYFPKLINLLTINKFDRFIIMPHFDKASNPIDWETIEDHDLNPWLNSFDVLEGKNIKESAMKRISNSLRHANHSTEKAIYVGTDAHGTITFIENLKNISFVLTEPTFLGLIKMVVFPKTRISNSANGKPYLLDKYIKQVKVNKQTINLSVGLNTIVGRRGSGKSFLINSIAKKAIPSLETKKYKFTDEIELIGNFEEKKVMYFQQSQLSTTLSDFINKIASEKQRDFDLIKNIFGGDSDRTNFCDPVVEFNNTKNSAKTLIHQLLIKEHQITTENLKKGQITIRNEFLTIFKDAVNKAQNLNEISILKNDLKKINSWIISDISIWFKNKLLLIKDEMIKIQKNEKYNIDHKLEKIYVGLSSVLDEKVDSKEQKVFGEQSSIISKISILNITEKYQSFLKVIDNIIDFHFEVLEGKRFAQKDITLENESLSFLTFDNKIDEIIDSNKPIDTINKFLGFNLKKNFSKKDRFATKGTILSSINISVIPKMAGEDITSLSVGTKHEKFMENILKIKEYDIIILDQPDDDLDAITIQENLIKRFKQYYNDKQWIIVTHDPKIVINSDSRKIIMSNFDGSFDNGKPWYYEVSEEELVNKIYKVLDSEKHYPYIRAKRYLEEKWK